MKTVPERLEAAANIYRERNAVYGDNYHDFGKVMAIMFPNGLLLQTDEDWNRIGILVQIVAKMTRYCVQFENGGHWDSLDDITVYSQMLRELDDMAEERRKDECPF